MTTILNPIDDTIQIIGLDIEHFIATNPHFAGGDFIVRYMTGALEEGKHGINIYEDTYNFDVGESRDITLLVVDYYEQPNEQLDHKRHPLMIADRAKLFFNFLNKQYSHGFGWDKDECDKRTVQNIKAPKLVFGDSPKRHLITRAIFELTKRNKYTAQL